MPNWGFPIGAMPVEKTQARLYIPTDLWLTAQHAMTEQGYSYSESVSRLLAMLVAADPDARSKFFRISPARALEIHAERAKPPTKG
jgi:hypothetical protein